MLYQPWVNTHLVKLMPGKKNKIMVIKNNTMYAVYTVVTVHEFGETARVHEFKLYVKFNFSDIALLST